MVDTDPTTEQPSNTNPNPDITRPEPGPGDERVLVCIPTVNEAANIDQVLTRTRTAAPGADILVIDGNSDDDTIIRAATHGNQHGHIHVLAQPHRNGLGGAYRAGFGWGLARGYQILIQMDADLSHAPETIPTLLHQIRNGADLVIGSRYVTGGQTRHWTVGRKAISRAGNLYANTALNLGVRDATAGFRAYRANLLRTINYNTTRVNGYGFQVEMTHRTRAAGGHITEVPITFNDRTAGTSKMNRRIVTEAMWLVTRTAITTRTRTRPTSHPN